MRSLSVRTNLDGATAESYICLLDEGDSPERSVAE